VGTKAKVPAVEGWFRDEGDGRASLLGNRCTACGTYFFPKGPGWCRNPDCGSDELEEVSLSRTGTVWSFSVNHYPPPEPYVASDPFVPYTVAAVELRDEKMVVLGQVSGDAGGLQIGSEVELVVDTLFEDDDNEYVVWKWKGVQ
jgi:uncharacterized OB-fold protein